MKKHFFLVFGCFVSFIMSAQKPELGLPIGHSAAITSVAYSPDGQYILTGSQDKLVKLWNLQGQVIRTLKAHPSAITEVLFSPKGNYIITESHNLTIVWTINGDTLKSINSNFGHPVFSPNEQALLVSASDTTCYLFDLKNNTQILIPSSNPNARQFSPDGQFILAQKGTELWLFDQSGKPYKLIDKNLSSNASAQFAPDQSYIAVGQTNGVVQLYNLKARLMATLGQPLETDEQMVSFSAMTYPYIRSKLVISNNSKYLFLSNSVANNLWEIKSPKEARPIGTEAYALNDFGHPLSFSHDSKYLLFRYDFNQKAYVADLEGNKIFEIDQLLGHNPHMEMVFGIADKPAPVAFAPNASHLLAGYQSGTAAIWSLEGDKVQKLDKGPITKIHDLTLSPSGEALFIKYFGLKSQPIGSDLQAEEGLPNKRLSFDLKNNIISPDANTAIPPTIVKSAGPAFTNSHYILTGHEDPNVKNEGFLNAGLYFDPLEGMVSVMDPDSNIIMWFHPTRSVSNLGLTPDNKHLFVSPSFEEPQLWDFKCLLETASRKKIDKFEPYPGYPIESYLEEENAKDCQLRKLNGLPQRSIFLAGSDQNPQLLAASKNDLYRIGLDGQVLQKYIGHQLNVTGAIYFKNDQFIFSRADDYMLKIWETQTGKEIASLFFFDDKGQDWVLTTPSGLFDASPGAFSFMYYSVGLEIIEIEQLKERYYEPGLLQKLLGFSNQDIRPVLGFDNVELYPEVKAVIEKDLLKIRLKERSGGIGKVSIFINGKEVIEDANPQPVGSTKRDTSFNISLTSFNRYCIKHPDSSNIVGIRAYNEAGWLKSKSINLKYSLSAPSSKGSGSGEDGTDSVDDGEPKLYAIVIGTKDYSGEKLDLQFADQDATAMSIALHEVGKQLFSGENSVDINCLSTTPKDSTALKVTPIYWAVSSKKNIQETFQRLKNRANAEDVLVVYLSGHGITYGGADQAQFYYLTKDLANENISDKVIRDQYAISSGELTKWINDIPALKQVLILDACNSGTMVESLTNSSTKALNSNQIRALDRMKDRTGMFILSGSASDKVSYEAGEYGQGLLTYALLEGMLGAAVQISADGTAIDVMKLFQYARDKVPELAASISGIQTPMLGFPSHGASFDIGILNDKVKIPIGNKKPVLIRNTFLNEETFRDDLELIQSLESRLRAVSEKGFNASFLYIDVNAYPEAYSISGLYKVSDGRIDLRAKLFKGATFIQDLKLRPTNDPDYLSRLIVREVRKILNNR